MKGEMDLGNDLGSIEGLETKLDEEGNAVIGEPSTEKEIEGADPSEVLRKSIEESYSSTTPVTKPEKKDEQNTIELGDEKFFSGDADALDGMLRSPEEFNKFIGDVYKKAVKKGYDLAMENTAKSVPEMVKPVISSHLTVREAVSEFYKNNDDLLPYKQTVSAIAVKIAKENPGQPLAKILNAAEKFARQRLSLPKKQEQSKGPNFPKTSGKSDRRSKEEPLTGVSKELDEMMQAL